MANCDYEDWIYDGDVEGVRIAELDESLKDSYCGS